MKHKEIWRTVKYLMVSASSGLIELGGYALLSHVIGWGHWISYLIALAASVLWNFTINRRYTFRSSASATSGALKIFLFYLVFTPLSAATREDGKSVRISRDLALSTRRLVRYSPMRCPVSAGKMRCRCPTCTLAAAATSLVVILRI